MFTYLHDLQSLIVFVVSVDVKQHEKKQDWPNIKARQVNSRHHSPSSISAFRTQTVKAALYTVLSDPWQFKAFERETHRQTDRQREHELENFILQGL